MNLGTLRMRFYDATRPGGFRAGVHIAAARLPAVVAEEVRAMSATKQRTTLVRLRAGLEAANVWRSDCGGRDAG